MVLAAKLSSHIKLYTTWDKVNYMAAKPEDYIVVRTDDNTDAYIVSNGQFDDIYAPAE